MQGDAGCGPRRIIRCGDACAASGCKPQSKTVPERFHVPAFGRGIRTVEVTNCDLKEGSRRPSVPTVCYHGTRSGNALSILRSGNALSILRSERAVQVNIEIMRAFVRLRKLMATHKDLVRRLNEMEKKYDSQFRIVFEAIRELMAPPEPRKRKIDFLVKERAARYRRK